MKVHNDLKKLLESYSKYFQNKTKRWYDKSTVNKLNEAFLDFNSLALGKPEPLAKNKQFDKSCKHDYEYYRSIRTFICKKCRKRKL